MDEVRSEERIKETMQAHGFDVITQGPYLKFISKTREHVTGYQIAIMQMAGEIKFIDFPSRLIVIKRSEDKSQLSSYDSSSSLDVNNTIYNGNEEMHAYLPVKEGHLSYEFHCLRCETIFKHKIQEPRNSLICNNCLGAIHDISNQYESAPIHISFDQKEVEELGKDGKVEDSA